MTLHVPPPNLLVPPVDLNVFPSGETWDPHVSRLQEQEYVVAVHEQPHCEAPEATPLEEHEQFWPGGAPEFAVIVWF